MGSLVPERARGSDGVPVEEARGEAGTPVEHLLCTSPPRELLAPLGRQMSGKMSPAWRALGKGQGWGLVFLIW